MRILLTNAERLCAAPTMLAQKAERFGVPGCSVALIRGGEAFGSVTCDQATYQKRQKGQPATYLQEVLYQL